MVTLREVNNFEDVFKLTDNSHNLKLGGGETKVRKERKGRFTYVADGFQSNQEEMASSEKKRFAQPQPFKDVSVVSQDSGSLWTQQNHES